MAAGKTITSRLVVQLVDKASGPARAISSSLTGINRTVQGMHGRVRAGQARLADAVTANNQALGTMRGRMIDAAAGAYVLARAISAPIDAAMRFESAMADVRKVVNFDTPDGLQRFSEQLLELSTRVPVAVEGLAQMAAAAGQAGIAAKDILAFTEAAAKVSTAFDIDADSAGDALAKLMAGLNLTIPQVMSLADAMNHLSDSQASSAAEILDVVRRVGATATQFGFTAEEVAAFASAMISAGAQSDVAATSFRNMGMALSRGESATKRQRASLAALGLEAEDVAKRMQHDAVGTTLDVLERIGKLPAEMRAAVGYDLFGGEARALGPLITNIDLLRESLGLVAEEMRYAGSVEREFKVRADTTSNALQIFRNRLERLSITIGNALLPVLGTVIDRLSPFVDGIAAIAKAFPGLTAAVATATAGLIGLRIAMMGVGYAGLLAKGGLLALATPILGLAGMMTRLAAGATAAGTAMAALAVRTRVAGAASVASMAGMSLASQNLGKAARASKVASALMVAGMGSQAVASARLVAGMSAASSAIAATTASAGRLAAVGAALAGIVAPAKLAAAAMVGLRIASLALVATGIGAVIAGIAAAGVFIAQNWEGITIAVEAFGGAFMRAIAPVMPVLAPITGAISAVWDKITGLLGPLDETGAAWSRWGIAAGKAVGAVVVGAVRIGQAIFELPGKIIDALAGLASALYTAGLEAIDGLWQGMVAKFGELLDWVAGIPSRIVSAIGSIDLSGMIKWPSMPSWLGGSGGAPAASSGSRGETPEPRAKGGPVRTGETYIVGEEGPEIFRPRQSGEIIPPDRLPAGRPAPAAGSGGRAGRVQISNTFHITGTDDPEAVANAVIAKLKRQVQEFADGAFADYGMDLA